MRQEAIKQAEKERREKYKKQEEEREVVRQSIREKVIIIMSFVYHVQTLVVWIGETTE